MSADIKPRFKLVCRHRFTLTFNGDKVFTLRHLPEVPPRQRLDNFGAFVVSG